MKIKFYLKKFRYFYYVYDIVMVNPSGDKTKILEGVLKIVSTVTQV